MFTSSQLQTIVDICIAVGEIGLGTVAIPIIFDKGSVVGIFGGLVTCFVFWYISIRISRNIKR